MWSLWWIKHRKVFRCYYVHTTIAFCKITLMAIGVGIGGWVAECRRPRMWEHRLKLSLCTPLFTAKGMSFKLITAKELISSTHIYLKSKGAYRKLRTKQTRKKNIDHYYIMPPNSLNCSPTLNVAINLLEVGIMPHSLFITTSNHMLCESVRPAELIEVYLGWGVCVHCRTNKTKPKSGKILRWYYTHSLRFINYSTICY